MKADEILNKILKIRESYLSDRAFLIILSIIIGLLVGIAAILLKNTVYYIRNLLTIWFSGEYASVAFFVYPAIGILLAVIILKFILRKQAEPGVPDLMIAISKRMGYFSKHSTYSTFATSSLTVGFGGSVGLEGPILVTGSAIASRFGRFLKLSHKQIILLIGCACAGAIASIFKAPVAGIVFVLEVIMLDLSMSLLIPLLMASATAALTSFFYFGRDVIYSFKLQEPFTFAELPYYLLLGVVCGLLSVYFIKVVYFVSAWFKGFKLWWKKWLIGSFILGLLIFILPPLYGEGYSVVNGCLSGDFSFLFEFSIFEKFSSSSYVVMAMFLALILFKAVATSVTLSAGGIGGIFAPSLFFGANIGVLFVLMLSIIGINLDISHFALAGMAGTLSGIVHAPLTAIFMIAEISGGYELIIPLMLVSGISFATVRIFEKTSIYTRNLEMRGELLTHDKDKATLSKMRINKLLETNFKTVHPNSTLRNLIEIISKSNRNVFPVVDDENNFRGVVWMDTIRHIMFKQQYYDTMLVSDLLFMPDVILSINDSVEDVAQKFHQSSHYNLPVLDNGKYIGFISRANLFSAYRTLLKDQSLDY